MSTAGRGVAVARGSAVGGAVRSGGAVRAGTGDARRPSSGCVGRGDGADGGAALVVGGALVEADGVPSLRSRGPLGDRDAREQRARREGQEQQGDDGARWATREPRRHRR